MDRPTGVYVISFLQVLAAAYYVGIAIFGIFFDAYDNMALVYAALVIGIFMFILSTGTWAMKSWAWTLTLIMQIVGVIRELAAFFLEGQYLGIFSLVIAIVIIYYLTRPEIKEGFGH